MVIYCKFDIDYDVLMILYMNFCGIMIERNSVEITCTSKNLILFLRSANKVKTIPWK